MVNTKNVASMPKGKCEFAASCSYRGGIYISGIGSRVDELWKYETAINQWLRLAKMWSPRCRHVMVHGTPNLLYVLGKCVSNSMCLTRESRQQESTYMSKVQDE